LLKLCGPAPWAAALAVGVAMIAMHLTGTFYPPAGIDPFGRRQRQWRHVHDPFGNRIELIEPHAR
jgi:HPP family